MTVQLDLFARPAAPPPAPTVPAPAPVAPAPAADLRDPPGPAQEPAEAYLARGLAARQACVFLWGGGGLVQVRFHDRSDGATTVGTGWLARAVAEAQLAAAGYVACGTLSQRRPGDRLDTTARCYRPGAP